MISPNEQRSLYKNALVTGCINAITTTITNWNNYKGTASTLVSSDLISSTEKTLFSLAVPLATILAFVLTCVAFFSNKQQDKPQFFPKIFLMAIRHSVFAFGCITIFALLFQRWAGSVYISSASALAITACIGGLIGATVNYLVSREILFIRAARSVDIYQNK